MAGKLSKFEMSSDYGDDHRKLSETLFSILDSRTDAATVVRDANIRRWTTREILHTFKNALPIRENGDSGTDTEYRGWPVYIVGSAYEGTSLPDMNSDVDYVIVFEDLPVVTDIAEAQQYEKCLLMIQDPDTPAGYAKLQWVIHGEPLFLPVSSSPSVPIDKHNRAVYTFSGNDILPGSVVHGPAITKEETSTFVANDFVFALRCPQWPDCAVEWLSRQRRYDWPLRDLIDYFKTLGCFLVCVGHPNSDEAAYEWRLSFSLQERYLVSHFNSVQHMCYILLKVIKKEIIYNDMGEESLTSYHCKTCILYLIENTLPSLWTAENLLLCLQECLKKILDYVEKGVCPNYFIPSENMFEGRITGEKQIKLQGVLRRLIASDLQYMFALKTNCIGDMLQQATVDGTQLMMTLFSGYLTGACNGHIYRSIRHLLVTRNRLLQEQLGSVNSCSEVVKRLHSLSERIRNTDTVTEHSQEDTAKALKLLSPYVEISLMSARTVLVNEDRSNGSISEFLTSNRWCQLSQESDKFSSRLKQASLLFVAGFYGDSLEILLGLEQNLKSKVSACWCFEDMHPDRGQFDKVLKTFETVPEIEFLQRNVIPCVLYLSVEKDLTPVPLCHEKITLDYNETWHDGAAVDGKILLYFLLYLNHQHLGMTTHAADDAENINWLLETDICLGHRETALNLLGWIFKSHGMIDRAMGCFQKSLAIRPTHNAAEMHMKMPVTKTTKRRRATCANCKQDIMVDKYLEHIRSCGKDSQDKPAKTISCSVCNTLFSKAVYLNRHKKKFHPVSATITAPLDTLDSSSETQEQHLGEWDKDSEIQLDYSDRERFEEDVPSDASCDSETIKEKTDLTLGRIERKRTTSEPVKAPIKRKELDIISDKKPNKAAQKRKKSGIEPSGKTKISKHL